MVMRMLNYNDVVCHFLMMMSPAVALICLTLSDLSLMTMKMKRMMFLSDVSDDDDDDASFV